MSPTPSPTPLTTPAPTCGPSDPDDCRKDAKLYKWDDGGKDIGLGDDGIKIRDATLICKNDSDHPKHSDYIRCLVEISGLPAGCSVSHSGPDKIFGTGDDGPTITGPGGGILQDSTDVYPAKDFKIEWKFKEKWQCDAKQNNAPVTTRGVADHGGDDYPAADDDDDDPGNNVKTRFHILKEGIIHDAKVEKLDSGGSDIALGGAGQKDRDVDFRCQNKSYHSDVIRCVLEVTALPAGCTATNAGPDNAFGGGDDVVVAAAGGLLVDDISVYPVHDFKLILDFKLRVKCSPIPNNQPFGLRAVADHGADDYPAADNDDDNPGNNVVTRSHNLKK